MTEPAPGGARGPAEGAAPALDALDRRLLNLVQSEFPLVPQPFAALGEKLGVAESEVIERLRAARDSGVLRSLSAIFDAYRVGYRSTLVCLSVPEERLEGAAAAVSAHPGVSHNYGREHEYNLWFVLALPRERDLEAEVADLARRTGATKYHLLPNLKLYKIGVEYDVEEGENRAQRPRRPGGPRRELTEGDMALVRVLQEELPLEGRPFAQPARDVGMTEDALLSRAAALQEEGIMRRFAAVIRHRIAGFAANGMTCWIVPEEGIDEIGYRFAAYPQVSHCYRRPTYDDWPYAIFTMIHAMTREKCEETVRKMAAEIGIGTYTVLYSHTEYKKERVKYYAQ
ncbi:MAG: AsnC family transcriptional regulator [Dehalococcoidia bacterium]|nr:AsnC family transcriptional regulator [Dehalococcoidia bacterium]